MKYTYLFIFLLAFMALSCKEKAPEIKQVNETSVSKVAHYICTSCENSGSDKQENCKTCNKPLVHNTAFHNSEFLNKPLNVPKPTNTITPQNNVPEPAQNGLGVYHYICPTGCAGGAGSGIPCENCGTQLVHNQLYHN